MADNEYEIFWTHWAKFDVKDILTYISRDNPQTALKILNRIDMVRQKGYDKFCFKYADSLKEGFERECLNYHTYKRQLDDKMHPSPPQGHNIKCPDVICAKFFKSGEINRP